MVAVIFFFFSPALFLAVFRRGIVFVAARQDPRRAVVVDLKSDSAQIALMVIGMCGRGSGINCVSSWIGCASWPGPSTSEQNDDSRHSRSSTRSTTGSTLSCSGTSQNRSS